MVNIDKENIKKVKSVSGKIIKIIFLVLILGLIVYAIFFIASNIINIGRKWLAISPELREGAERISQATNRVARRSMHALACSLDPFSEDCIIEELKEEAPADAPTIDQYKLNYGADIAGYLASMSTFDNTTVNPGVAMWIFSLKVPTQVMSIARRLNITFPKTFVDFGCDVTESIDIIFHCTETQTEVEPDEVIIDPQENGTLTVACKISGKYYGDKEECVDEEGEPIYPMFYYITRVYADYEGATASMFNILAMRPETYASLMSRYGGYVRDPFEYLKIYPDPYLQTYWKGTRGVALVFGYGTQEFGYKPHLIQDSFIGTLKICIKKTENNYYGELRDIKDAVFYISGWIDLCKNFHPSSCSKSPVEYKDTGFSIKCSRVDIENQKYWECRFVPDNGDWSTLVGLVNYGKTGLETGAYCTYIIFRATEEGLKEIYGEEAESFEYAPIRVRGAIKYVYRIYGPDQYIKYISSSYIAKQGYSS